MQYQAANNVGENHMAGGKRHIPSADEIREMVRVKDNCPPGSSVVPHQQLERIEKSLKELTKPPKVRSPQEMREGLQIIMDNYGMSPEEELVRMVMQKTCDDQFVLAPELRTRILEGLMQYRMPKLRAMEITGTVDHSHTITIVRYGDDGVPQREKTIVSPKDMRMLEAIDIPSAKVPEGDEPKVKVVDHG